MIYTIYSIGDAAFLQAILNAVAMLAATGDYRMAGGIGGLLGILFMVFRSFLQWDGRGLRYQDMLAALLIYLTLFVPSTPVAIEDAYTGQVRVVDQVPLGPAVAGSILSNLGYRLTVLFEQGFSTPSMTRYGFADALQVVTAVRKNLLSRIELGKANAPTQGSDIENSVINYVKECTLTGVDLHLLALDSILRNPQVLAALRFDSEIYTTEIYTGAAPRVVTCTAAWPELEAMLGTAGIAGLEERLRGVLGVNSGQEVAARLQTALDALTQGQVHAQDYMVAATLLPMFEKGIVGRHEDSLHWSRAAMVEQAIQQRNAQWAAEQTLFSRMVRPMLAWIEGFSYAITPLMAFSVMLGARGIQMTGQYFLMLLWIQLWMPILAIINLYIMLSANAGLAALNRAEFNLPSMAGLYHMDMELQNWLSVGAMLASSTPAIALMLVYGGSITATHFLSRMQGGDFVDEKIASPPVVNPAALLGMQTAHQHAPVSGTTLTGAEKVLPTFQLGQDLSASVTSSHGTLQQSAQSFMKSLAHQASHSSNWSREGFAASSLAQRLFSSESETDRFLKNTGEDFARRYRDSGVSGDDFAALIGGAASGALQLRATSRGETVESDPRQASNSLQAGISGQLQNRFHVERSKADEIATDIAQRVSSDQSWQADLASSLSSDAQSGTREVASLGLARQDLSSLQQSAQDTVSASKAYQEAVTTQQRFGSSATLGAAEAGLRLANNPDSAMALDKALDQVGLRGDAQRLSAEWQSLGLINDPDQSYAAAGLSLLTGHSPARYRHLAGDESRLAESMGHALLGEAFRASYPDDARVPEGNAALRTEAPPFGGVRVAVEQEGIEDPRAPAHGLEHQVQERLGDITDRVDQGKTQVTATYQETSARVRQSADSGFDEMDDEASDYFREAIHQAATAQASPAELSYDVIGGAIYDTAQHLSGVGGAAVNGFLNAFNAARDQGQGFGPALLEAAKSAPEEARQAFSAWAEEKVAATGDNLTPAQQAYYRASLLESFAGVAVTGDYHPDFGSLADAQRRLTAEDPETASDIAELLRRAAGQNRHDLIDLVGHFNRAQDEAY
ncbi:MAG: conjugal transfer protein TraG N-terminal domain-containing protein [Methylococcaceae bacterium]|nr:conjugal transfer protein TraG N-terminal domain-containing protein [Methylococcaceae bacterium]